MLILLTFSAAAMPLGVPAPTRPPPEAFDRAPNAADHVAIEEVERKWQEPRVFRQEVTRSGSWLRTGDTGFSDFSSGVSLGYRLNGDGRLEALSLSRQDARQHFVRTRTGETDQSLGETCEVWRTVEEGSGPTGVSWLSCDTADGIRLWSRVVSGYDGTIIASSRTVEFQRRDVRAEEVRPPGAILDWHYWRSLAEERGGAALASPAENYAVRLENLPDGGGGESWQVMRRRGDWSYRHRGSRDGRSHAAIDQTAFYASIEYDGSGENVFRFQINRQRTDRQPLGASTHNPVEPRQTETVLGEECVWSTHGGPTVSGHHQDCVTADDIPLRIVSHHRVLIANLTAVEVDRAVPHIAEMMPPRRLFEWRTWGIDLDD